VFNPFDSAGLRARFVSNHDQLDYSLNFRYVIATFCSFFLFYPRIDASAPLRLGIYFEKMLAEIE